MSPNTPAVAIVGLGCVGLPHGGSAFLAGERNCSIIKNSRSINKYDMESAAAVLFGKSRQAVLALLFDQPERSFYLRELARLITISTGALQHELNQLLKADLVERTRDGNRVIYRANTRHPIFPELQSIVRKTCGIPAQLQACLSPFAGQIAFATIYGSFAKGTDHARSDVDLLIVGDIGLEQAVSAVAPVEARIGREISVRLISASEYRKRRDRDDPFLAGVMSGKHIPILGGSDDA